MVTNNEAVENFLKGKRNLAAYQFSQLIRETTSPTPSSSNAVETSLSTPTPITSSSSDVTNIIVSDSADGATNISGTTASPQQHQTACTINKQQNLNSDEVAFNYAMVNLFTGCPQRASIIFSDLVKRYPRNPRLWLRLSESMLAAERSKLSEFEHIQQLAYPHSRDHLIKTKNKPVLIKINPNYCQQQIQQQFHTQRGAPSNFLVTIKGYLTKALNLIDEFNDISLLNEDIPRASASKLSQKLSYTNPYQSISRSALYHLRNKVQLNLAYVCLCMGEPSKALIFTTQCLKSSPQGYEKVLASLYHAEACILASRIDEAIQFLNIEVLNMAKSLSQDHPLVVGDTKRVVYSEDMQRQFDSGALATVVTYNLSVAYAAKGEFNNAQKILMRCIQPAKPCPMQVIICLLYIQLQQGQLDAAKRTILSNLPQFR